MNSYLMDLEDALKCVGVENYYWTTTNKNGNKYIQEAENNFSSEIIGYFRSTMRMPENQNRYQNLKCHFDILKGRHEIIRPDIVLHEDPDNQNQQIFYCEVKIDTYCNLKEDLEKLSLAVSNQLNFHNAVMIVANRTLTSTIDQIKLYMQNELPENLEKIFLFHAKPDNDSIIYNTFNFLRICRNQI